MMLGQFDTSSLWQCNFNPYSEVFNDIYPKILEQLDIDRPTFERFMNSVNALIKNMKKEEHIGNQLSTTTIAIHVLVGILSCGIWLFCFVGWWFYRKYQTKKKIDVVTESTKWKIGQAIIASNRDIFHPKGLDVVAVYDLSNEGSIIF